MRKSNYLHNIEKGSLIPENKMINGQALGDIAGLKYGLFRMSWCGCEVIAVCNALNYVGKPVPVAEAAHFLERYRLLLGFFGCNAYKLGRALKHFGLESERTRDISSAKAFIVSFWTGKRFLSPIHTVFCVRTKKGIMVYNRYNKCPDVQICRSAEEITGGKKPITAYIISQ